MYPVAVADNSVDSTTGW